MGRFVRLDRETGSVSAAKFGGYKEFALAAHEVLVRQLVAGHPDVTLADLVTQLSKKKITVGKSSVSRFLHHLKLSLRKVCGPPSRTGRTSPRRVKHHVIGNVERPRWKWLKLSVETENDADHFRIKALNAMERDAFVSQLKSDADSVLLFVHGYNVTFADAIFKAAQIAFDANFAGTVLVFSWPSAGNLFKYDKDRESAEFAAPHLTQSST